ncbi:MAG: hypothetical protein LUQ65_13435 [Candidatus Helarchaeota archaeon]|nr:hypothetical protein [Candidatus Helarchaeota archaeon]
MMGEETKKEVQSQTIDLSSSNGVSLEEEENNEKKRGPQPTTTNEEEDQVRRLAAKKMSYRDIASETNLTLNVVRRILKNTQEEDLQRIKEQLTSESTSSTSTGKSPEQIGAGVAEKTMNKIIATDAGHILKAALEIGNSARNAIGPAAKRNNQTVIEYAKNIVWFYLSRREDAEKLEEKKEKIISDVRKIIGWLTNPESYRHKAMATLYRRDRQNSGRYDAYVRMMELGISEICPTVINIPNRLFEARLGEILDKIWIFTPSQYREPNLGQCLHLANIPDEELHRIFKKLENRYSSYNIASSMGVPPLGLMEPSLKYDKSAESVKRFIDFVGEETGRNAAESSEIGQFIYENFKYDADRLGLDVIEFLYRASKFYESRFNYIESTWDISYYSVVYDKLFDYVETITKRMAFLCARIRDDEDYCPDGWDIDEFLFRQNDIPQLGYL